MTLTSLPKEGEAFGGGIIHRVEELDHAMVLRLGHQPAEGVAYHRVSLSPVLQPREGWKPQPFRG